MMIPVIKYLGIELTCARLTTGLLSEAPWGKLKGNLWRSLCLNCGGTKRKGISDGFQMLQRLLFFRTINTMVMHMK